MRQRPTLEALEPRILFSADTPSALAAALVGTPDAEHRLLEADGEFAVQSAPQEIVFIDARTPDFAQLVADITAQSERDVDVIVLDAERNGLDQISEVLARRENVAALHVIGHGGEGVMQLGNTLVTADSLERNPGLVEAWGQVLTADADILLYGCDIAATAQGRLLADTLARLTGADVSASDDATGHASLGGDWSLEYTTGLIDVQVAPSSEGQAAWLHLLNTLYVAYEPDFSEMQDHDPDYEVQGGNTLSQTFSYNSGAGTYSVDTIDLVLYKNAAAGSGGNVQVQIRDAVGAIASGNVSPSSLGLSEAWVSVTLNAPAVLTDGQAYSIRVSFGPGDVFVGVDDTGAYADGDVVDAVLNNDMAFRLRSVGAPVVDLDAGAAGNNATVAFTEQTPVPIAPAGTLTDADTAYLESLTATLTVRPDGDGVESLSLNATAAAAASGAGLTVTYAPSTGVLLIQDTDLTTQTSLATWQTILQGIEYNNTSDAPTTSNRLVTVVADDGPQTSLLRTSTITVTAVNDAPVLTAAAPSFGTITEDQLTNAGDTVAALLGASVSDVDAGALEGIAITSLVSSNGSWQYSIDGGTSWSLVGAVADNNALLLRDTDRLRFVPDGLNADAGSVSYRAWDRSSGTEGTKVDVSVNGGTTAFSTASDTASITVTAVNDAPVNTVPGAQATNEDTALVLSSANGNALSIADVDAGASPVQVTLSGTNGLITLAGITGLTFSSGDGTADATMSFTGTVADINSALNGLTFAPNPDYNGAASLSLNTSDQGNTGAGGALADTDAVAITVTAVNDAPLVDLNGAGAGQNVTVAFTEQTPVLIAPAGTLTDLDSANLSALTLTLTARPNGNAVESLSLNAAAAAAASGAGLTVSYTAGSGVLSITGSASAATYQTILQGVQYNNTSDTPNTSNRSVTVVANDGALASVARTSTVTVTAVNDAPLVDLNGAGAGQDMTVAFTEQTPVRIAQNATITDPDSANVASLTLTLTARPDGNSVESLSLNAAAAAAASGAGLTVSYTAATGVLSITGSAPVATYQTILRGVQYNNTSDAPTTSNRSVTVVANDGALASVARTSTVTVTAVNDAPVLSAVQLTVNEGGTRVFAPADFSISDPDSGAFTYTVSAVAGGSFEVFNGATWNAAASFTTAQVAAAQVRFVDDGDELAPSFSITANDGATNSATIAGTVTYTPVNDAPVVGVPGAQTGNEDGSLVFSAGNGNTISIADLDAGTSPVQVVLTGTNGAITLAGIAGLTFSVGDGVADGTMTFTGSRAAVNAALDGLSFMPSAGFSGAADLSISVNDQGNTGAGGPLSDSDVVAINILPNVAPTVTASGGTTAFTEGSNVPSTSVVVDAAVTVSDPDSATLAAATISLGAGWQAAEDILGFTSIPATMGNIAGSYNAATGVLSLTSAGATATLAQWQEALRSVVYTNTSDMPNGAVRTVSFVVTGQGGISAASTQQLTVTAMNDAPTLGAGGGTTAFAGGGSPVIVDSSITVSDLDNGTLSAARVWISGGFQAGQDVLGFSSDPATMGNITGSYNAASGLLTLNSAGATASLAQWQAALRSVTYGNTSATPVAGVRSVSFDVNDGTAYAVAAASHGVDVSPAPVAPDPGPPPVVTPPPVIPPVVVSPPPVTPPLSTTPPAAQPAAATDRPAGTETTLEATIEPVNVDFAERPHNPMAVIAASSSGNASTETAFRLAGYGTSLQRVDVGGGDLLGEGLRHSDGRASGLSQSGERGRSAAELTLAQDLEALRDTLGEQDDEFQNRGTVALAAGSLSMTLAYLLWLVRGGALVASALSALPAWRMLDPLPVLTRVSDDEDEEEGEVDDDEAIASFAAHPAGTRQ